MKKTAWMSIRLCALAAFTCSTAVYADLPPLIDRDAFFGEIKITAAQISPDGEYIAFLKPYKGTRNIWVKTASEPFSAARPMSAETKRPVSAYFWSRDSKPSLCSGSTRRRKL
jgi:hypothetical protein